MRESSNAVFRLCNIVIYFVNKSNYVVDHVIVRSKSIRIFPRHPVFFFLVYFVIAWLSYPCLMNWHFGMHVSWIINKSWSTFQLSLHSKWSCSQLDFSVISQDIVQGRATESEVQIIYGCSGVQIQSVVRGGRWISYCCRPLVAELSAAKTLRCIQTAVLWLTIGEMPTPSLPKKCHPLRTVPPPPLFLHATV